MAVANFENRTLYKGDNLDFLRGINSETIDLIATDPPFNKGRDFHATPDSLADGGQFEDRWRWVDDVQPEWLDQIKGDAELQPMWQVIDAAYGASGEDMATSMYSRYAPSPSTPSPAAIPQHVHANTGMRLIIYSPLSSSRSMLTMLIQASLSATDCSIVISRASITIA